MSILSTEKTRRALLAMSGWALTLGVWLITRPFRGGGWHDGLFYTTQALRNLFPARYDHDLFFQFGSQDQFTLFSPFYARLITWLGLDLAPLILVVLGAALWLASLSRLAKIGLPHSGAIRLGALLLVLSANPYYGADRVLSFSEPYASPRIFAEACVMIALASYLVGSRTAAALWFLLGLVLHPLMTLPGIAVALWAEAHERLRWRTRISLAGSLMAVPLVLWLLVTLGIVTRFDSLWLSLVRLRSPFLFPDLWRVQDFSGYLFGFGLLWAAVRAHKGRIGGLAAATLMVGVIALWSAWLAASVFEQPLFTATQSWRFQWLVQVIGLLLAVPAMTVLWSEGGWERALAVCTASSFLLDKGYSGFALGGLILVIEVWRRFAPAYTPSRLVLVLLALLPLQAVAWWLVNLRSEIIFGSVLGNRPAFVIILQQPVVVLLVWALAWATWKKTGRRTLLPVAAGVAYLAVGASHWDMRHSKDFYETSARLQAIRELRHTIPQRATVYWEDAGDGEGLRQAWFWLQRANYVSFDQSAGNVFSRETALEADRRASRLKALGFMDQGQDWRDREKPDVGGKTVSLNQLRGLCRDRILDFVVLSRPCESSPLLTVKDPASGVSYGVHACAHLRGH